VSNTAKVMNMEEAEATCQRNRCPEIKIATKCNTTRLRTVYDDVMLGLRIDVGRT